MKRGCKTGFSQGALDGMCGVYSIINYLKMQTSLRISDSEVRELYDRLCDYLDGEGLLRSAVTSKGLGFRAVGQMIDVASDYMESSGRCVIYRKTAFKTDPEGLAEFWRSLQEQMSGEKAGVILGLSGKHDHWTCLEHITDRQIRLLDSDGLSVLNRNKCTIHEQNKARIHALWPTQTYYLNLSDA